jgi:mannose-6-phosphate isomerase
MGRRLLLGYFSMHSAFGFLRVLPNRVRRNYRGGKLLDGMQGITPPVDGFMPESWIASTVAANNPGMPLVEREGLTRVCLGDGSEACLVDLVRSDPDAFLGRPHQDKLGLQLGFLGKLLDSAARLQMQAHPTSAFAQAHMGSRYGKLEVYYILAVREGVRPEILLGFQHAPERQEWRRIIETQDLAAMNACFEPVPVAPGEVWLIPGGMPHAIGEGILMVELMEPSDLVVRCEFARDGMVVPEAARFMGRSLDFCLDIFNYEELAVEEVTRRYRIQPNRQDQGDGWQLACMIGPRQTDAFVLFKLNYDRVIELDLPDCITLLIQTRGNSQVSSSGELLALESGQSAFAPAAIKRMRLDPGGTSSELLLVFPGWVRVEDVCNPDAKVRS